MAGDRLHGSGTATEVNAFAATLAQQTLGCVTVGARREILHDSCTGLGRKSRHLWMAPLPDGRTAPKTLRALTALLKRIPPPLRRTLTWDQGSEMTDYAILAKRVGISVYFADPHSLKRRGIGDCLFS